MVLAVMQYHPKFRTAMKTYDVIKKTEPSESMARSRAARAAGIAPKMFSEVMDRIDEKKKKKADSDKKVEFTSRNVARSQKGLT